MGNLDLLSYEALLEESLPVDVSENPSRLKRVGVAQNKRNRSLILDGFAGWIAFIIGVVVVFGAVVAPPFVFTLSALIGAYIAVRLILTALNSSLGFKRIKKALKVDWRAEYARLQRHDSLAWESVLHVAIIPNYKEDFNILADTLARLAESPIAREQVCVVLAMEEREQIATEKAEKLTAMYQDKFKHILQTYHPKDIPGEVAGKSSNEAWAARKAYHTLVHGYGYDMNRMVITIMDADSLVHPRYLEALTCHFATTPVKMRFSTMWQAPIRYDNNIWKVNPFFSFMHAYSTMSYLSRLSGRNPMPLSTYSLSFRLAHDVGYWDTDVIPEDWHMYIKCYFKRNGNLNLQPIYLPFSGYSAAVGESFFDAFRSQYAQAVRHMWGAEDVGYIIEQSATHNIPLTRKFTIFLNVTLNHTVSTIGWIATNLGMQLALSLHPNFLKNEVIPHQMLLIQLIVQIIVIITLYLWVMDMRMRPRKEQWRIGEVMLTGVSFFCVPISTLTLSILPAFEAQARLMFGVPITYRVARKV